MPLVRWLIFVSMVLSKVDAENVQRELEMLSQESVPSDNKTNVARAVHSDTACHSESNGISPSASAAKIAVNGMPGNAFCVFVIHNDIITIVSLMPKKNSGQFCHCMTREDSRISFHSNTININTKI